MTDNPLYGHMEYFLFEKFPVENEIEKKISSEINIPTYKFTNIYVCLTFENKGTKPLNQLTFIHEGFSEEFRPPQFYEISLQSNNCYFKLSEDVVSIDQNSLAIRLKNLADTDLGLIYQDDILKFHYQIHCIKPPRDSFFQSEITFFANTEPQSEILKLGLKPPNIQAEHLRRKFRIGKEVISLEEDDNYSYEIHLNIENVGEMPLENLQLLDKISEKFEYSSFSHIPKIKRDIDKDVIMWTIDSIEPGNKIEVSFQIYGNEKYIPTRAQLVL